MDNNRFKMKYLYSFLLAAFLLLPFGLKAQNVAYKVVTQIDSTSILIGNRTGFRLVVTTPKDAKVYLPILKDTLTPNIEIIGKITTDSAIQKDGSLQRTYHFLLTSFDSGMQYIPSIPILVKDNQKIDTLHSESQYFKVEVVPVDTTKGIADIKPPVKVPYTFSEVLPYIGAGLLGIILLLAGIWAYRRWKQHKPFFPMLRKVEPPHIVAFRELDKLKDEKLWQQGHTKQYYSRLTDILRTYLEGRFYIQTMEKTSSEIIDNINNLTDRGIIPIEKMQLILSTADLAKFAKVVPNDSDNMLCLEYAYAFVESTKPIVVENEEDKSKNK
jgi:hypothetical protein